MENKNVFIGNLDFEATKEEVKTLLSDYGTVVNIKMHKKKGCAFVEMSNETEAALAIEKLNGVTFKGREVRISLEMKTGKAKAFSINKYHERKKRLSAQRPADSPHPQRREWPDDKPAYSAGSSHDGRKSGHGGSSKPERNYNTRERYTGSEERPPRNYSRGRTDSPHPQRKEWQHDKPAYPGRPSRDGRKSGYGRPQQNEMNYNSRERYSGPDERPPRNYSRKRSDSTHPQRREWSDDKPAYPGRPARDGRKSGHGRSPEPEINYNTRERFPSSDDRPPRNYSRGRSDSPHPQRKEWPHDKPAYPGRPTRDGRKSGYGRSPKPETNYNSRERYSGSDERPARNYSRKRPDSPHPQRREWSDDKPAYQGRPSGASRKPGFRGKNGSPSPARPNARGGAGNRGRISRPKKD